MSKYTTTLDNLLQKNDIQRITDLLGVSIVRYYEIDNISFVKDWYNRCNKLGLSKKDCINEISPVALREVVSNCIDYLIYGTNSKRERFGSDTLFTVIQLLGEKLKEDKFAYLVKANSSGTNTEIAEITIQRDISGSILDDVYKWIMSILSCMHGSCYYNIAPDETGRKYYADKIEVIRKEINMHSRSLDEGTIQKLQTILNEVKAIILSYTIPNVNERWLKYNQNINYFDCVYDFVNTKLYQDIIDQKTGDIKFNFIPSPEDIQQQRMYFDKAQKDESYVDNDLLYQQELCNTFKRIFHEEFDSE